MSRISQCFLAVIATGCSLPESGVLSRPDPESNPERALMLSLNGADLDPDEIDFAGLPRLNAQHAVLSDVRHQAGRWVHQHAYLARHDGRYWAMWSDGPGIPKPDVTPGQHRNVVPGHDQAGTRVSFATSEDGVNWTGPGDLSGPPRIDGYGWIARGYWERDGQLLALASHFNAPGYPGPGLSLEAFRWDSDAGGWVDHGRVLDDAINNFPPKRLPDGRWMMSRRDHQRQVTMAVGGIQGFDQWEIHPMASYNSGGQPEEPYWYVLPDGKNVVGLIRDNAQSKRLLRTFSTDNGRTWSKIVQTNFPDATSKFFAMRTSKGYFVLVSNASPSGRDPLTLSISDDGLVYDRMFYLVGGRHVDYPHIIEHDGHLLISFSGAKQTVETLKISLADLDAAFARKD
ncbi:MAG: exo-alpha-sialidase [Bryobacterales bacterium]|nr:exo-alpha-sialidase [Bryobacterales bacterium]